jgi:glycine cleavage system H lipoate-binding protein
VNQDPLGEGWLFVLRMENPADKADLLDSAAYQEHIAS